MSVPSPADAVPGRPTGGAPIPRPAPPADPEAGLQGARDRLDGTDVADLEGSAEAGEDLHRRLQARLRDIDGPPGKGG